MTTLVHTVGVLLFAGGAALLWRTVRGGGKR